MQSIYAIQSFKKLRIYIFICLLNTFLIFEYLFNSLSPPFNTPSLPHRSQGQVKRIPKNFSSESHKIFPQKRFAGKGILCVLLKPHQKKGLLAS